MKIGALLARGLWIRRLAGAVAVGAVLVAGSQAMAWSHQGHILLTRMAVLRIIDDPQAPAELRAFLKKHMPYDLAACEKLAVGETAGAKAENYLTGLDGASTWPDRILETEEGKNTILEPYGMAEFKMHFLDMEAFAKERAYKDDLSNRPKLTEFPRDPKDPRYKLAGFLPFRVGESYKNFVTALGDKTRPIKDEEALKWLGYMAHYMEDAHQPQHGTMDYKSLSYLAAAKVPGVHAYKQKLADGTEVWNYQASNKAINPHGDVEYQLFENTQEPRKSFRKEYWRLLQADLVALDKARPAASAEPFDGFAWTLATMGRSYGFLPLIGRAAQKAYATGAFDAGAFFPFKAKVGEQETSVLEMIAGQNARAVVEVDAAIRRAWMEAKVTGRSQEPGAKSQK